MQGEGTGTGRCACWKPGPRTKSFIFWSLSLFALMINGASISSTTSTPWAIVTSGSNSWKVGLWKYWYCAPTCDASTTFNTNTYCYTFGIGAGVILILVMTFSMLTFFFRMGVMCSKDQKWMCSFKVFMVLKSITGICLPAVAIGIWTENCYKSLSGGTLTWSVGQGILIVSMAFEICALYGIREAWGGPAGTTSTAHA